MTIHHLGLETFNIMSKPMFKSKWERELARQLLSAGVPFEYESMKIPYSIPQTYKPDFILPNGIIIEAKGYFRPSDRRKHLQIKREHPELDIRFVFKVDNKIHSKSNMRYSDWCKKHGFLYAIGGIPEEWLREEGNNE